MKKIYMILLIVMASCSDEQPESFEPMFYEQRTELNRQFYATGDLMSVEFRLKSLYKAGANDGGPHSIITYGKQVDDRNDVFTLTERDPLGFGYYGWICTHQKDFMADHRVDKISHKIVAPNLFEEDYFYETTIPVFENRRIDFLMDKLAPKNLKSTYLEQVFVGEQKIKAPQIYLLGHPSDYSEAPKNYQELRERDYGSFAGLYGQTSIYGDNVIDSIEVRAGNLSMDSGLTLRVVVEDIVHTYGATIVSEGDYSIVMETEEFIFNTHHPRSGHGYSYEIITTVKRKP